MRCYRSADLYNWEDCGLIIPPDERDETSPLHPSSMMDRPHILYNRQTKKYVCWLKIMEKNGRQTESVLTADSLLGPYAIVRRGLRPLGMSAGDFDLASAPDGKGYYFFERVHSETIIADLTEDYTDVTGYYSVHFPQSQPPFVREATAHFVRRGRHYLVTSGTTGYLPNPSQIAVADTWHGPYRLLGDLHPEDASRTSFHSQISSVFKVPGKKDLYIALADRWAPDHMHLRYQDYGEWFRLRFAEERTPEEEARITELQKLLPADSAMDTSKARYVWLPFRFEGEMGILDWRDQWSLDEFE